MKILFIQGGFGAGGAEKVMAGIASHRHEFGDEVHVAAMMMPETGSFFAYPDGVKLHVLAENAPRGVRLHLRRGVAIRSLVRELRPDLIVSFLTKVNCLTLLASAGTGIPVVISERNNPQIQSAGFWSRLQNRLAPQAAGIAMQTKAAAGMLPKAQRKRAAIIPNPCHPVEFPPAPASDICRFVGVGRLDHQKGFDRLIRAFAALPLRMRAQLEIFGEGQERDTLTAMIREMGLEDRVRLAGLAHTPQEWMSAGDVLVLSSRYEGFSNVLAEATSSGLPVIAFDCPFGVSDMVIDGGNGMLIPDGDEAAMIDAMQRLAHDAKLRARLSASADVMAARLSPDSVMAQWDALFEQAISGEITSQRRQIDSSASSS
ncbi:glycosyltransferase family 4 protein [Paracoccus aerodenitrificans]|uniref:glycosyltransferase family 4 protein n=1 Tax=Paracoccus aerodenitrificans TaxID=3017781 RepID=UPI0022F0C813|nr:glycosyltransferase family 4 protein [Paracoccus aerodenitrificans]WBU63466.1 glycosyltransferase family 4 protein [Paracoccus aerodenitrificans]